MNSCGAARAGVLRPKFDDAVYASGKQLSSAEDFSGVESGRVPLAPMRGPRRADAQPLAE